MCTSSCKSFSTRETRDAIQNEAQKGATHTQQICILLRVWGVEYLSGSWLAVLVSHVVGASLDVLALNQHLNAMLYQRRRRHKPRSQVAADFRDELVVQNTLSALQHSHDGGLHPGYRTEAKLCLLPKCIFAKVCLLNSNPTPSPNSKSEVFIVSKSPFVSDNTCGSCLAAFVCICRLTDGFCPAQR